MTELSVTTNDDVENNISIQTSGADPAVVSTATNTENNLIVSIGAVSSTVPTISQVDANITITEAVTDTAIEITTDSTPTSILVINEGNQGPPGAGTITSALPITTDPNNILNILIENTNNIINKVSLAVLASGHNHDASNISNLSEAVDDRVANLFIAGTGI